MNLSKGILKKEERAVFALRELYRGHGYRPYKMSKFEGYDLYVRNKDFLVSDQVITFTDQGGRLLAMKPDVTLSIIKNYRDVPGQVQKVYYDEHVYRVPKGSGAFKEILQTGLECMGPLDAYHLGETVLLAAKSLEVISENFVLDLSHMGFVSALMDRAGLPQGLRRDALRCVEEKNAHELSLLCRQAGLGEEAERKISCLVSVYGPVSQAVKALRPLCDTAEMTAALEELAEIGSLLAVYGYGGRVNVDFSVEGDMRYYSGLTFRGFVEGIPDGVLSGGQYDGLMARMGKKQVGAIGFAVYLDLLERLEERESPYDVDVVILYDDTSSPMDVTAGVEALTESGKTALALRSLPETLRCRQVLRMKNGRTDTLETNA